MTDFNYRIGQGYDVHRLVPDRKLYLGGVEIPCEKGLLGHSDADVLIHALCDALLGAAALGDIGRHFPDNDPRYAGIRSTVLLLHVCALIGKAGYAFVNADMTVIAEAPKIAPYIQAMRESVATCLKTDISAVSIKATTEEGLGFTGRKEGIAASAVVLLYKQS